MKYEWNQFIIMEWNHLFVFVEWEWNEIKTNEGMESKHNWWNQLKGEKPTNEMKERKDLSFVCGMKWIGLASFGWPAPLKINWIYFHNSR